MAVLDLVRAITVLKKEGWGGPARYDHDHRFNGFCLSLPKIKIVFSIGP